MDPKKRQNRGSFNGGASQAKRGKSGEDWEDSPSQFEEELAQFDDPDMEAESSEGQAGHDVIPVGKFSGGDGLPASSLDLSLLCTSSCETKWSGVVGLLLATDIPFVNM